MDNESDYMDANKELWNKRTDFHYRSPFYNVTNFIKGASSLHDIELHLLGNITHKTILHLQCHFGQDTISLERLGARVTGVDFSDRAITKAKELSTLLHSNAHFICSNLYDLGDHLEEKFDIVFASYGTIGWLQDLNKWGRVIADRLAPGGKFIFVEFHPVIWMFDDNFDTVAYSYFKKDPIIEMNENTYADENAPIQLPSFTWNHSISEVFEALTTNGLTIDDFKEYDYSPYDCFRGTTQIGKNKYIIQRMGGKLPMVYSMVAASSFISRNGCCKTSPPKSSK